MAALDRVQMVLVVFEVVGAVVEIFVCDDIEAAGV